MTPLLRKFSPKYAEELVRLAENDCKAARKLSEDPEIRKETTIFMVQQCIEKCLKAVICRHGHEVPMIHDLAGLLAALPRNVPRPPSEEALDGFSEYATVRRYEEGFAELKETDVQKALAAASQIVNWAKKA